jgi:hypothetical protein
MPFDKPRGASNQIYSFMDGYRGYNEVKIAK